MSWWKGSTRTGKSALNRTFPPFPPYPRECKKQDRSRNKNRRSAARCGGNILSFSPPSKSRPL
eukprot:482343-Pleurochrysis_carterae.AAC.1